MILEARKPQIKTEVYDYDRNGVWSTSKVLMDYLMRLCTT